MGNDTEEHEGQVAIVGVRTVDSPPGIGVPTVKYVHYAGAQQLILWLPQSGWQGYGELNVAREGEIIERAPVRSRVNGSIQIIWNTLPWPPGDYRIVIPHDEGWRHEVTLHKHEPGVELEPPDPQPVQTEARDAPISYRDGLGNVIPEADRAIRERVAVELSRRIEYSGTYRAGQVIYTDGVYRVAFGNEMCGGDIFTAIDIPTAERWEAETGIPLELRAGIVAFVAERVQQDQARSWRYRITDRSIEFY